MSYFIIPTIFSIPEMLFHADYESALNLARYNHVLRAIYF